MKIDTLRKTLKVALLTNFIPPYRVSTYKEIAKHVKEFHVFVSVAMESNRNWNVNHKGLNVTVQKSISFIKTWSYNYKSPVHLPYDSIIQLKRYNPDVVVSVELGLRTLLSFLYCKWYKKPHILWLTLSEHTERNKEGVRLIVRKYLLKRSKVVFCNGESGKRYAEKMGHRGKVFLVPYTSDYRLSEPKTNFRTEAKRILYTGSLIHRKGVKELVENLTIWAETNKKETIELFIAGSGNEEKQFKKLDSLSNINYQLLGSVSYSDLRNWYEKVDLYLFPTLEDEWGVVVNEAFSSGTPVIGSIYSQAVLELVKEQETGWLFDPLNKESFQKALQEAFAASKEDLEEMSKKTLKTIAEYTPEKITANVIEAINWVSKTNSRY